MLFFGDTVKCDTCGVKINELDDQSNPEEDLPDGKGRCRGCWARLYQEFVKNPCYFCKKPIGDLEGRGSNIWYNIDDCESMAHEKCVLQQDESEQGNWSDEID